MWQGASLAGDPTYLPLFAIFRAHPLLVQFINSIPFRIFGVNDLTPRLISVMFGLGGVVATYATGAILYGRRVGLVVVEADRADRPESDDGAGADDRREREPDAHVDSNGRGRPTADQAEVRECRDAPAKAEAPGPERDLIRDGRGRFRGPGTSRGPGLRGLAMWGATRGARRAGGAWLTSGRKRLRRPEARGPGPASCERELARGPSYACGRFGRFFGVAHRDA